MKQNLNNSSSNPTYLNFCGTAKEIQNQVLTPVVGNTADIYKNFIVIEIPVLINDSLYYENNSLISEAI